jgi:Fe-S cluster assembly iron-binding protein IscA
VTIRVTDEALEVLKRSLELGGVDASSGGIRLRGGRELGGGMRINVELAGAPAEGEEIVEAGGIRIFVDRSVTDEMPSAVVALEPEHETVVVRPGDTA